MKGLKNALIFLAGGFTFIYLETKGLIANTKYPREGSVVYEDNSIKVIRMTREPGKNIDLATITYKQNHSEKEES